MAKGNPLPVTYEVKAGKLNFFAGTYKGKALFSWDIVASCTGDKCPAYLRCPFDDKDGKKDRCVVQLKYVKAAGMMMFKNYAKVLSSFQLYAFGLHVMPLIAALIKLKLIEIGLGVEDIVQVGKTKYIHPVFREIRETIRAIYSTCREVGIDPKTLIGALNKPKNDIFELDQSDYVTELMGETDSPTSPQSFNFKSPSQKE
jgi:hypothetical protein